MTSLRIFLIGGRISYRALFNWISPWIYIPTMLGGPLFLLLFFTYLGRDTGLEDESFFVVGNAVFISTTAAIYGSIMSISNERFFGTLPCNEDEAGLTCKRPAVRIAVELDLCEARLACHPLELAGGVDPEPILDGDWLSAFRPVRKGNLDNPLYRFDVTAVRRPRLARLVLSAVRFVGGRRVRRALDPRRPAGRLMLNGEPNLERARMLELIRRASGASAGWRIHWRIGRKFLAK